MNRERLRAVLQLQTVFGDDVPRLNDILDSIKLAGVGLHEVPAWSSGQLIDRLLFSPRDAERFGEATAQVDAMLHRLDWTHLSVLTRLDDGWPDRVARPSRDAMTPWLYILGDAALLSRQTIGIGGSREATPRSIDITRVLAGHVVTRHGVVVSGGARGVDSVAHQGALQNGGKTIVVLAQGIATFSIPPLWREAIELGQLAVVSEFHPWAGWEARQALQRNGTVVRLSDAFVVIQAEEMSGTISAGRSALRMKRPLYVVQQTGAAAERAAGSEELIASGGIALSLPADGSLPGQAVEELLAPRTEPAAPPSQMRMF